MRTASLVRACLAAAAMAAISPSSALAGYLDFKREVNWASNRDLSTSSFSQKFKQYARDGYMIIDTDAYSSGASMRYAMIWQKNHDRRKWAQLRNMTSDSYNRNWKKYRDLGYRPADIEVYKVGSAWRYAGIWIENKEKLGWWSRRNMTSAQYGDAFKKQSARGYRLVDMEAYRVGSQVKYSAIWVHNKAGIRWAQLRNMTRSSYQNEVNRKVRQGYQVVDYEAYDTPHGMRYAAIWNKVASNVKWAVRTDRTELQFANYWREYRDKGYRIVDFERYQTPSGPRYAGVWMENRSDRADYSHRGGLDSDIEGYRSANTLPGISVAIIRNGKMVYRRGFGDADMGAGKEAHGQTVYYAASISKAIAATMAAKLESQGRIDLTRTTRSFLINRRASDGTRVTLPSFHRHTLDELMSHTGCVRHYRDSSTSPTTPGISNPANVPYPTDLDAAKTYWNVGLMPGCVIGSTYDYSTHAWTIIGAALESAMGDDISDLVERELFDAYKLGDLRFIETPQNTRPGDYDRAKPYTYRDNGTPREISYGDVGWKRLGGGMEASPVDLARFGWKVLNGQIVPAGADTSGDGCTTIDNDWLNCRMFNVMPGSIRGLGWRIRTRGGRRVAEHGGDGAGFRTLLRLYRDDGLVVAIMANGKGPGDVNPGGQDIDLNNLADTIVGRVLP
ncbi:MAG: serine hydrolase [Pseudomonadota bacterium]